MSPRRPTRRIAALAAALLLPLALVACGGDGDDSAEVVDGGSAQEETTTTAGDDGATTTTEDDGGATTTTEGTDDTTTTTEGGGEPASDLAAALLTVDDLPAGFTQDGDDDTSIDMGDEAGLCQGEAVAPPVPVEQITRSFESGDQTAYLASFVGRFEGTDATGLLDWFRDETERCNVEDPDEGTYTVEEIPGVGDEAVILVGTDEGGSADVAVARVGDVLVGVSSFAEPGAAVDVQSLLALSAGRV
jgi:hypothetical protein